MTIRMVVLPGLEERGELCCLCTRGFVKAVVAVERTREDGIALYGLCGNHAVKDVRRLSHFISPEIERDANGSFLFRY
jgi:hypothetical protein